jgi:hypothetical protein
MITFEFLHALFHALYDTTTIHGFECQHVVMDIQFTIMDIILKSIIYLFFSLIQIREVTSILNRHRCLDTVTASVTD